MTVTLDVPDNVSYQLVYRMERNTPSPVETGGWEFLLVKSAAQAARNYRNIAGYCGEAGAAKALVKLFTPRRSLYLVTREGRTVSAGWCTIGRCRYYKVEPEAVVIGPIWTAAEARGQGLATAALQFAINEQIRAGRTLFYIDTEKQNLPAQRVFAKAGFGAPVALYFR